MKRIAMLDIRPVIYVIGLFVGFLGVAMLPAVAVDALSGSPDWRAFAVSSLITMLAGAGAVAMCRHERREGLSIQQTFILTALAWIMMPLFGALPFMLSSAGMGFTDAFFEAMSGITTTGATVMSGLDGMDRGVLLWRGVLQWTGGLGIIVVAIAILPELQIGGMQLFRSEGFDTFGKILPRAAEIASQISMIYAFLTGAALFTYVAFGMEPFDALVHSMTTIATGGLANYDSSFGYYTQPGIHYTAAVFMMLSSLPYVRYVQVANGSAGPLFRDPQVRTFFAIVATAVGVLTLTLSTQNSEAEASFRHALFNAVSIISGTGYASDDYGLWGPFAMMMFLLLSLIGGCAGSTCCSVKVFRYQVLAAAITAQIRMIHNPSGVFRARYDGRPISDSVISSVMAFFMFFFATLALMTLAFSMMELDFITALSAAVATLGNVGPGLGPEVGPSGNYAGLPTSAKWVCIMGMLLGRLELLSILVMLTPGFWRR